MNDDPNDFEGINVTGGAEGTSDDAVAPGRSVFGDDDDISFDDDDAALPHWTEPATGAVPTVSTGQPTVATPVTPAPEAPLPEERLPEARPEEMAAWAEASSTPQWADSSGLPPVEPVEPVGAMEQPGGDDFFGYDEPAQGGFVGYHEPSSDPAGSPAAAASDAPAGERDMALAVGVGIGLAAVAVLSMAVAPVATLVVVTILLSLAAVEFFNALRVAGHHPAVLLGLASVASMPAAVYWRGEAAIPLVLFLSVVAGALWYLTGVSNEVPLRGLSTTMLGIVYIGVLGSYAALMLSVPTSGTGLLTAAILVTVAYDVGGLVVGRTAGRQRLSSASPNKTIEGLVGGCVAALVVAVVIGVVGPSPFGDKFLAALVLGLVAAVAAPIGDLMESLFKRDLGIKDMGAILPGHGGILDRFDGLLFVLPATYWVARLFDLVG